MQRRYPEIFHFGKGVSITKYEDRFLVKNGLGCRSYTKLKIIKDNPTNKKDFTIIGENGTIRETLTTSDQLEAYLGMHSSDLRSLAEWLSDGYTSPEDLLPHQGKNVLRLIALAEVKNKESNYIKTILLSLKNKEWSKAFNPEQTLERIRNRDARQGVLDCYEIAFKDPLGFVDSFATLAGKNISEIHELFNEWEANLQEVA